MADYISDRLDVYTRVTNKIVEAIEAGADRWDMPWHVPANMGYPVNAASGKAYRGVNILTLWVESQLKGYSDPTWATYKQWQALGKQVAKGEKSTIGVFWKRFDDVSDDACHDDEQTEPDRMGRTRMMARGFSLFNACQTEGYEPPQLPAKPNHERIESAEAFFRSAGASIRHGGSKAFYHPTNDFIQMPPFDAFRDPIAYYSTLAHESTHWTGHRSRLDRDLKGRFGDESYAAEELIAELGGAFLAATLGLTPEPRPDHAAYIQSWLKILKNDNRAIFTAASHAQRAADYLHDKQSPAPTPEPPDPGDGLRTPHRPQAPVAVLHRRLLRPGL